MPRGLQGLEPPQESGVIYFLSVLHLLVDQIIRTCFNLNCYFFQRDHCEKKSLRLIFLYNYIIINKVLYFK